MAQPEIANRRHHPPELVRTHTRVTVTLISVSRVTVNRLHGQCNTSVRFPTFADEWSTTLNLSNFSSAKCKRFDTTIGLPTALIDSNL